MAGWASSKLALGGAQGQGTFPKTLGDAEASADATNFERIHVRIPPRPPGSLFAEGGEERKDARERGVPAQVVPERVPVTGTALMPLVNPGALMPAKPGGTRLARSEARLAMESEMGSDAPPAPRSLGNSWWDTLFGCQAGVHFVYFGEAQVVGCLLSVIITVYYRVLKNINVNKRLAQARAAYTAVLAVLVGLMPQAALASSNRTIQGMENEMEKWLHDRFVDLGAWSASINKAVLVSTLKAALACAWEAIKRWPGHAFQIAKFVFYTMPKMCWDKGDVILAAANLLLLCLFSFAALYLLVVLYLALYKMVKHFKSHMIASWIAVWELPYVFANTICFWRPSVKVVHPDKPPVALVRFEDGRIDVYSSDTDIPSGGEVINREMAMPQSKMTPISDRRNDLLKTQVLFYQKVKDGNVFKYQHVGQGTVIRTRFKDGTCRKYLFTAAHVADRSTHVSAAASHGFPHQEFADLPLPKFQGKFDNFDDIDFAVYDASEALISKASPKNYAMGGLRAVDTATIRHQSWITDAMEFVETLGWVGAKAVDGLKPGFYTSSGYICASPTGNQFTDGHGCSTAAGWSGAGVFKRHCGKNILCGIHVGHANKTNFLVLAEEIESYLQDVVSSEIDSQLAGLESAHLSGEIIAPAKIEPLTEYEKLVQKDLEAHAAEDKALKESGLEMASGSGNRKARRRGRSDIKARQQSLACYMAGTTRCLEGAPETVDKINGGQRPRLESSAGRETEKPTEPEPVDKINGNSQQATDSSKPGPEPVADVKAANPPPSESKADYVHPSIEEVDRINDQVNAKVVPAFQSLPIKPQGRDSAVPPAPVTLEVKQDPPSLSEAQITLIIDQRLASTMEQMRSMIEGLVQKQTCGSSADAKESPHTEGTPKGILKSENDSEKSSQTSRVAFTTLQGVQQPSSPASGSTTPLPPQGFTLTKGELAKRKKSSQKISKQLVSNGLLSILATDSIEKRLTECSTESLRIFAEVLSSLPPPVTHTSSSTGTTSNSSKTGAPSSATGQENAAGASTQEKRKKSKAVTGQTTTGGSGNGKSKTSPKGTSENALSPEMAKICQTIAKGLLQAQGSGSKKA
jgi:hypothetical protein